MKRILAIILALFVSASFVSCDEKKNDVKTENELPTETEEEPKEKYCSPEEAKNVFKTMTLPLTTGMNILRSKKSRL